MSPRRSGGNVRPLAWGERLDILDALTAVLEGVYVHLPLKRALYGFDVVRGLAHLRQQVPTLTDLEFHRELTSLINRLRDAHTQYHGPWAVPDAVASLPFLVESFGPPDGPTYVVSKIDRRSIRDRHFVPGVTIEYWNGTPFDRAVQLHAESETGGRPDARRARALESLTFRSLEFAPPPNEEWVVVGYRDRAGKARQVRLYWEGIDPKRAPAASRRVGARIRRGINDAAEAVRRAKKYRFNRGLWKAEQAGAAAATFADFLSSRTVRTRNGTFGLPADLELRRGRRSGIRRSGHHASPPPARPRPDHRHPIQSGRVHLGRRASVAALHAGPGNSNQVCAAGHTPDLGPCPGGPHPGRSGAVGGIAGDGRADRRAVLEPPPDHAARAV